MNDGAFLASVEASSPAEFGRLLTRPSVEEERVLRRYFGDERYRRWHNLALLRRRGRRLSQDHAPVVIIPDLFLCELFTVEDSTRRERLWLSPQRLIAGDLERLRLARGQDFSDDDDEVEVRVEPGSAMKRVYGELILTLAEQRPVYLFGYDWRRSARQTARSLAARIADWIGDDDSFHLVAHGFGGIIARTFIADHSERWTHRPRKANGKEVGRLIMLGTPNQGAYSSVRTLAGLDTWVRRLAILDNSQERRELLQTLNTFPSLYETLPSPVQSDTKKVYDPDEYGSLPVSRANFESAKEHYRRLNTSTGKAQNRLTADVERMVCLAGYGYCTASGLVRGKDLDTDDAYRWDDGGDGVVPHTLVRIQSPGMAPVPMVYVREEHIGLPANRAVLSVLDDLLTENLKNLQAILPVGLTTEVPEPKVCPGVREADPKSDDVSIQLARAAEDLRSRSASVRSTDGSTPAAALSTTPDEEGAITDSFLQPASDGAGAARARPRPSSPSSKIEMRVVLGDISRTDPEEDSANLDEERDIRIATDDVPIDVIAVGHYSGLRPQAAVQDLDIAISKALLGSTASSGTDLRPDQRLLAQYTDRGTITAELARLFFLPDPRKPARATPGDAGQPPSERLIAIAGMGWPGRFGAPELVVLARELCWVVGRFGKQHLATTLIGSGKGNLSVNEAIYGWTRGILAALRGGVGDEGELRRITFVHRDPARVLEIDAVLSRVAKEIADVERLERLVILESGSRQNGASGRSYRPMAKERQDRLIALAKKEAVAEVNAEVRDRLKRLERLNLEEPSSDDEDPTPTRMTLGLDELGYRFSILTSTAAVPERVTAIDRELVLTANSELATQADLIRQEELGRYVGRLVLPAELRPHLSGRSPVAMVVDRSTARIHWEMVSQPDTLAPTLLDASNDGSTDTSDGSEETARESSEPRPFPQDRFLGTARGLTRQLRTAFAPPPEPPPPHRRLLRVLVVADPADDASLEGAEREGAALVELFEAYNRLPVPDEDERGRNRVEVVSLLGPVEATRSKVLERLINDRFDVLHFAGHCWFDEDRPQACGWLFHKDPLEYMSANELNRIDRIPKFVFSNACQSGVTPLEPVTALSSLAPSFAESFFNRGVDNFVCTAWKVHDLAGLKFALCLYEKLLGLEKKASAAPATKGQQATEDPLPGGYTLQGSPRPMWEAMRDARIEVANIPEGARTWGAYQHYGNPFYRMFAPAMPTSPVLESMAATPPQQQQQPV